MITSHPASLSTLAMLIAEQAKVHPDSTSLMTTNCPPLSYSTLNRLLDQSAMQLRKSGVGRDDIVAVALPNGPEMAASFLAVACAAICAPLNPQLTEKDHAAYLAELGAKAVLIDEQMVAVRRAAESVGTPILRLVPQRDQGAGWFDVQAPRAAAPGVDRPARPEDTALILPTSGTTSRPKLVPLSHRNLCVSAGNIRNTLRLEPSDRCLNVMPLFHIHGLVGALLSTLSAGGSIICTRGFFGEHFASWLNRLAPTWYSAVPTIHQSVLGCVGPVRDSVAARLRFVRSSSASLPPSVMAELETLFQAPVIEAYGMTEAAHQMASNPLPPRRQKPGSVGLPSGPEIAVIDENGDPVPPNAVGEILIRGDNVTSGYLRNDSANREAFRDGWFRTGDQGRFDEDGYLHLTGRTKELINRGGEKIAPREVEEALLEHPAVTQAVSFAVPHRTLGEDVGAAVILAPNHPLTSAELRQFSAERLPPFKVPRVVRVVEEIPKGPTGKLQRIGLAERLGLGELGESAAESEYVPPSGPLEDRLAEVWRESLQVSRIGALDDFFVLGGHSLMAAEVVNRVSLEEDVDLPHVSLYENSTLRTFAQAVEAARNRPRSPDAGPRTLMPIRTEGSKPPLFCAPGHENHFGAFARIARHLGPDQPVYGLPLPRLNKDHNHYYIDELAAGYIKSMREMQPLGPYFLIGHCHGGYVAFEIARQLQNLGERVAFLCLMDAYLQSGAIAPEAEASGLGRKDRLLWRFNVHASALAARSGSEKWRYVVERIAAIFRKAHLQGKSVLYSSCVRHGLPVPAFLRQGEIVSRFALRAYRPGPYHGSVLLVRTLDTRSEAGMMGWQGWITGSAELIRVPPHPQGLGAPECVAQYFPQLANLLDEARRTAQVEADGR